VASSERIKGVASLKGIHPDEGRPRPVAARNIFLPNQDEDPMQKAMMV
jgi:hypothetical protein